MKRLYIPLILAVSLLTGCQGRQQEGTSTEVDYATVAIPAFDADSAYSYVAAQLSYGYRTPGSAAHEACATYLARTMRQWCDTVIVQSFTATLWDGSVHPAHNIICSFAPEAERRVVLGAHWDSRLWADHDPDAANHHKPLMGANDGASGVGLLMEMARVMSAERPKMGVDIVFFDMEDQGVPEWAEDYKENSWCLGAQYWVTNPHTPCYRADYGILFDMVGTRTPRYTKEEFSRRYAPGVTERVWKAAAAMGLGHIFVDADTDPIMDDHLYVNQFAHIPMLDIVQHSEGCSFFPYWHTVEDNLDCISAESLKATADVVLKVLYQ